MIVALVLVVLTLAGGTLSAAGANAINCYIDRDIDGMMARTRSRPLPDGRIEPQLALIFGIALGVAGLIQSGGEPVSDRGRVPAALDRQLEGGDRRRRCGVTTDGLQDDSGLAETCRGKVSLDERSLIGIGHHDRRSHVCNGGSPLDGGLKHRAVTGKRK